MQATITGIQTGTSTETSKLLTKILNTFYTSGIDRIKTYGKTPSGNIVGEFIADGTSFQYVLNLKANTVSYEPVGNKTASKADSLLAEQENADRFKAIYSMREAFEVSDASVIEQKLDSWFFRSDAATKSKVGVKTAANKSGKTLTCTPGKTFPCGAVCRAMGKPCKQPMSPEVQEIARQVVAKISTPTAATTVAPPKPLNNNTLEPKKQVQKNPVIKDETTFMSIYIEDIKCQGEKCKKIESTDPDPLIVEGLNLNPIIVKELPDQTYEVIGNHSVYAQMSKSERAYCLVLGKHHKPFDENKIAKTTNTTTTPISPPASAPVTRKTGGITAQKLAEQIAATKTPESDLGKKGENRLMPIFVNSKRVNGLTQEFDEKDLREAAEVFIKLGGFTEPPVLKRKGEGADISYDLISGEFQVATAIVAKAMQPRTWDTFPATVIEEGNEELIQKQMKAQKNANAAQNTGTTKPMSYKQFESNFEADYKEERRRQELRGVVAIRTREMKALFTEKHNISGDEFDKRFNELKKKNKVFTVIEKKDELMQWVE